MAPLLDGIEPGVDLDMVHFRPLRGRVVVQETKRASAIVWTPEGNPRERKCHRGKVLAVGAPPRTAKGVGVAADFRAGDEVYFVFAHLEKPRAFPKDIVVVSWEEVIGVVES